MVGDRFEDITPPQRVHDNPEGERDVALYGWLHGCNLKAGQLVHVAGVGDCTVADLTQLADPCPLPSTEKKQRKLDERQKLLYAPMSDVGGLLYDKDAVYISMVGCCNLEPVFKVPNFTALKLQYDKLLSSFEFNFNLRPYFKDDKNVNFSKRGAGGAAGAAAANGEWGAGEDGEPGSFNAGVGMVHGLQDTQLTLDEKLARSEIQLFGGGRKIRGDDDDDDGDDDDDEEDDEEDEDDEGEMDEEDDGEEDAGVRGRRTSEAAAGRQRRRAVFTAAGPAQEGDDGADWQDADSDDDLGADG